MLRTVDKHPALLQKPLVLARSGVYKYTYEEMIARGHMPKVKKSFYTEFRSPEVLVRNKDKFAFITASVEHTEDQTTPGNFHNPGQVDGVVGDTVQVEKLADGNIALTGKIALYTKDAKDYYDAGNRETSADYDSMVGESKNPAYDYELVDIVSVNSVAMTRQGRGGPTVRVMDSAPSGTTTGGLKMKRGFLSAVLGIGRSKDSDIVLSKVVFDGIKEAVRTTDATKAQEIIDRVCAPLQSLGKSEDQEVLVGVVHDSFVNMVEVLGREKDVSTMLDDLYTKCRTADAAEADKLADSMKKDKKKDKEDDDEELDEDGKPKAKPTKDSVSVADLAKMFAEGMADMKRTQDSVPGMITAGIAAALGTQDGNGVKPVSSHVDTRTVDSMEASEIREEAGFLLRGSFGGSAR